MSQALKNSFAGFVFTATAVFALFFVYDTTPEMAWSHSQNRCVHVTQQGKKIQNGCKLVLQGKLRAERYIVE